MLLQQRRGQACFTDVLQEAEQAEQPDIVGLALQEAAEHHHVHANLERASMRRRPRLAQLREQEQRVRVADHAVGKRVDEPLHLAAIEARGAAFLERLHQLLERLAGLRVERARRFDLVRELGLRRVAGIAVDGEGGSGRGRRRRGDDRAHVAPPDVDEHLPAELAQRLELPLALQEESLKHERRFGPRSVELGDVHAELQVGHRYGFLIHAATLPMPLGRRLLRTGGGLHVLTGSHLDEHRPANEFCRAG